MVAAIVSVDDAHKRGGGLAGLSCGIAELDAVLGGLTPSNLFILAGRPGMGKTALAQNVAFNVARQGVPVRFFSLEMSAAELALRQLSAEIGIPASELRRGNIDADSMRQLVDVQERLAHLPLVIDDSGGLTMPQLATRLRRTKRKHRIGLAVIDYLQLVGGSIYRGHNRTQEITEITTGLKALAKELDIPILALSQLSREVEKRGDKRPLLADLRDSGSIEQDADAVAFVYREVYYLQRNPPDIADGAAYQRWQSLLSTAAGKAEIIIAKLRNGPMGTAHLSFDESTMTFGPPKS
jgi:replicative DNA helicase